MLKKTILCCLSTILLFVSCTSQLNDPIENTNGSIQFSFNSPKGLLKTNFTEENVKYAVYSIEDNSGNIIAESITVNIQSINGSYISDPIDLEIGNLKLVKFLLLDKDQNVIYVSPIEGSKKASFVDIPLKINFNIEKDKITYLNPEVLPVGNASASDFGYLVFGFRIVKTFDFFVSTFLYNSTSSKYELTNANIEIKADTTFNYSDTLSAATNRITVLDDCPTYNLIISKMGYKDFNKTFSNTELKSFLDNPLMVNFTTEMDSNVVFLLKSNGINGSQDFKDYSVYNLPISGIGNPKHSNVKTFNSETAIYLDGDDYLDYIPTNDLHLSVNNQPVDFTIDAWINLDSVINPDYRGIMNLGSPGATAGFAVWGIAINPDNTLRFVGGSNPTLYNTAGGSTKLKFNNWHHIAVVCKSNLISMFVDGKLENTTFLHSDSFSGCDMAEETEGALGSNSMELHNGTPRFHFYGFLHSLRVTKGKALWTENFTPPVY